MRASIGMTQFSMMLGTINELKDKVVSLEQKVKELLPQADGLFAHVKLNPDFERKGTKRLNYNELKQVVIYVAEKANIEITNSQVEHCLHSAKVVADDLLKRKAMACEDNWTKPYTALEYRSELESQLVTECKSFFPFGACKNNWGAQLLLRRIWSQKVAFMKKKEKNGTLNNILCMVNIDSYLIRCLINRY